MARFFAAILTLLFLSTEAHATLALIIPTRDGFVVAADSRVTYLGTYCDGTSKILISAHPARTIAVVTGDSLFVRPPDSYNANPCEWLASAPRLLDIGTVTTDFLNHTPPATDPTSFALPDLVTACVRATKRFQKKYRGAFRSYAGKEIFSVVVASYNPGTAASRLSSFVVRMTAHGSHIEAARVIQTRVDASTARGVWIHGETDWVNDIVYQGPGRRFLSADTLEFLQVHRPVADVQLGAAESVAANVMKAAIRTARISPPPSGIGGEIQLIAVGSNPLPQQLPSPASP
jgi:hypothetical protein